MYSLPAVELDRPMSTIQANTTSIYDEMVTAEELDTISSLCLKKMAQESNAVGLKQLYDLSLEYVHHEA
jgi:hypothetical protein